jgi:hypothetical protein
MKVVYKKSVLEQIHDAVREADKDNRKIDHILLTGKEMRELHNASARFMAYPGDGSALSWPPPKNRDEIVSTGSCYGVELRAPAGWAFGAP